jgi:hypothetical protein
MGAVEDEIAIRFSWKLGFVAWIFSPALYESACLLSEFLGLSLSLSLSLSAKSLRGGYLWVMGFHWLALPSFFFFFVAG